jgi:hypothetical protein
MNRLLAIAVCLIASHSQAQLATDPPCKYSAKRTVAFYSANSRDQLTVSIGSGACHSAKLTIVVTSDKGKVLYRYDGPFKRHTAVSWDDRELPNVAREFVEQTLKLAVVEPAELPKATPRSKMTDDDVYELALTEAKMKGLLAAGQPVLYHDTYYEGGQFVTYDPAIGKSRVVIRWGL